MSMILRHSQVTFISSLVYWFSWNTSMCGMMLKGSGWAKNSFVATVPSGPLTTSLAPLKSSSMPSLPAPDAAWYVDISTRLRPYLPNGSAINNEDGAPLPPNPPPPDSDTEHFQVWEGWVTHF